MPEFAVFVPWLILESDLYRLIPERAFTDSVGGWPMLRFTLRGVTAVFGFNFVTDDAGRFTEVQRLNDALDAMRKRRSFRSASATLREHLGPPNVVDMPEFDHLRWDDGRVWVDNAITTSRSAPAAKQVTRHSLSVTLSPQCRPSAELVTAALGR